MLALGLLRRFSRHTRALRTTALLAAALAVVGLAVTLPHTNRAGAADNFATVTPQGLIGPDSGGEFRVEYQLATAPAHATLAINGSTTGTTFNYRAGDPSGSASLPVTAFKCSNDNSVRVDIDYEGVRPSQTQTLTGIALLCPTFSMSPTTVVGTDPVTVTLSGFDDTGQNGFDSQGTYNDAGSAKKLFLNGTQIGGAFGYKVAPQATITPRCGDNEIKLTQSSPYGPLEDTKTFTALCSTWSVGPQGLTDLPRFAPNSAL